jgi:hypothetical protein
MKKGCFPTAKPYMGRAWREEYGRSLTRDEIRLLQAYRGVAQKDGFQEHLLNFASALVIDRDPTVAAARVTRAAEQAEPYHWKCDEPAVTKEGGAQ